MLAGDRFAGVPCTVEETFAVIHRADDILSP
jgi:hypothetical protein